MAGGCVTKNAKVLVYRGGGSVFAPRVWALKSAERRSGSIQMLDDTRKRASKKNGTVAQVGVKLMLDGPVEILNHMLTGDPGDHPM